MTNKTDYQAPELRRRAQQFVETMLRINGVTVSQDEFERLVTEAMRPFLRLWSKHV